MATTTNNGWATPNDSDPFKQGASAMRTLGQAIDTSVGTGLLAWTVYTPTLSNITLGVGGSSNFRYAKLGKLVFVRGNISLAGAGTVSGTADFTLPISSGMPFIQPIGQVNFYNGANIWLGTAVSINASTVRMGVMVTSGAQGYYQDLSAAVPFAWNTGATRQMFVTIMYEAA
jgi:hypothetical protein